jgi:aspartate/methionine/tyrosine aminotransferase
MAIEAESPEERGYANVDCNLSESSVSDANLSELGISIDGLTLAYCEHRGDLRLREVIAAQHEGINPQDVLVTAGAASALFIAHTTLLEKGDHVIVEHPNYGTNIETPRAIECDVELLGLKFEAGFQPDLRRLGQLTRPATRLISITNPHNPTGVLKPLATLEKVLEIAAGCGAHLLADETYRDVSSVKKPPLAASIDSRAISVSSVSKAYGLPGIRIGWIICKDTELVNRFLAAKEQIFICNSVVDETIALRFLEKQGTFLPRIRARTERNYELLQQFMAQSKVMEWVRPDAAVVGFPRFKPEVDIDTDAF